MIPSSSLHLLFPPSLSWFCLCFPSCLFISNVGNCMRLGEAEGEGGSHWGVKMQGQVESRGWTNTGSRGQVKSGLTWMPKHLMVWMNPLGGSVTSSSRCNGAGWEGPQATGWNLAAQRAAWSWLLVSHLGASSPGVHRSPGANPGESQVEEEGLVSSSCLL